MTKQERQQRGKERRAAGDTHGRAYADILAQRDETIRPYAEALEQARVKAIATFQAKSAMIWQVYIEAIRRIDGKYPRKGEKSECQ